MVRIVVNISNILQEQSIRKPSGKIALLVLALCVVSSISSCGSSPSSLPQQERTIEEYIAPTNTPIVVDEGVGFLNNLNIRIDSITIRDDDGDSGLGGEVYFAILAARQLGGSAKLIRPGSGTYKVYVGDTINNGLDEFSLAVNNLQEQQGEKIIVYFLAFETDAPNGRDDLLLDLALQAALAAAEEMIPGDRFATRLAPFALSVLSGQTLEWWQEEDLLGEYSFVLNKENNWMRDQQLFAQSSNGNLDITFTILQSADIPTKPGVENVLTVVNNSSIAIERLFVAPSTSHSWGEDWLKESILPSESVSFSIPAGIYDLRAETSDGKYWESERVDLAQSKKWTITN